MLDPRVQQKGGFGAFAARQQERLDERAAAEAQVALEATTAPVAPAPAADAATLTATRSEVRRAEKILSRTRDGA
jgi:hypothetical protein